MRKPSLLIMVFYICLILRLSMVFADLEEGDRFLDKEDFSEAISNYEEIIEESPGDYEALWRLSRSYSYWGFYQKEKSVKREYLNKSVDYAKQAIEVNDAGFEGHLYLAETLGKLTDFVSSNEKVRFSHEIKSEAEKAIKCNPGHYRAYMILGTWHKNVMQAGWMEKELAKAFFGGLPDASYAEAEKNLKRSVELKGDYMKSRYELALVYKALKNKEAAREELKKALNCPVMSKNDEKIKKKVSLLLKRLK